MSEGKLHGLSTTYARTGQLLSKTWYHEGKKTGIAHFYFLSGALASLQRFEEGQWEGLQEYFYEDGQVKSHLPFLKGQLHGIVALFWEGGGRKREVHYHHGRKEGPDTLWNLQGLVLSEGLYSADQPVGVHRHFFKNGALKEERIYHAPLRYDRKEWSMAGELLLEGRFDPDLTYTETRPPEKVERKGVWRDNHIQWI